MALNLKELLDIDPRELVVLSRSTAARLFERGYLLEQDHAGIRMILKKFGPGFPAKRRNEESGM